MWILESVNHYIHEVLLSYLTDANEALQEIIVLFEYISLWKGRTLLYVNIQGICAFDDHLPAYFQSNHFPILLFKVCFSSYPLMLYHPAPKSSSVGIVRTID